jgi:LmbE family N-acetylglucosaminyl deacetylase
VNILAIGAHPDDIEFGCGGTLIKYARKGHDAHLLVLTDGGRGGDAGERRREQEAAAKLLGAHQLFWGGYLDTEVTLDRDLIQKVEGVLHRIRPQLILAPFGDDTHQDHRYLSAAVVTASRYTRNVLFYEGPTTANFTPSVFVDIGAVLERKFDALRAHASQVAKTGVEHLSVLELAQAAAHFRGIQGRVRNAEAFVPLRLFINVD